MGEFSITHWLIILAILLLFFGPSKLPGLGASLGKAIRGFKSGLNEIDPNTPPTEAAHPPQRPDQLEAGSTQTKIVTEIKTKEPQNKG